VPIAALEQTSPSSIRREALGPHNIVLVQYTELDHATGTG